MNRFGRVRAPRQNGGIEASPPLAEFGSVLAANLRESDQPKPALLERNWRDLRGQARSAALAAAMRYHARLDPLHLSPTADRILMAGHQPELFHPGVWVKNFALQGLARAQGATALNLVVDNDTVKTTAVRLPVLAESADHPWPHLVHLPFETWTGEVPYEEKIIQDELLFDSFAERAGQHTRAWGFEPFLGNFWQEVKRQRRLSRNLGECFVAARRHFERAWGCVNLEIPASALNDTEPFAWFACHLLENLPSFGQIYNRSVDEYRRRQGIRSRSHPVPNLAVEGDWWEAPLWFWTSSEPRRSRLFVRQTVDRLELRAGQVLLPSLPRDRAGANTKTVRAYQELAAHGLKVRSRALVTTLYCRLFLADFFLHGIGGGKYDELTDDLIRQWYGVEPPGFGILTATLLLPFRRYPSTPEDQRAAARRLRDLRFNPQRYLPQNGATDPDLAHSLAEREQWVKRIPAAAADKKQRFLALRRLNSQLASHLSAVEKEWRSEWQRRGDEVQANAVLDRRDYPFCFYPEATLRSFYAQFLNGQR